MDLRRRRDLDPKKEFDLRPDGVHRQLMHSLAELESSERWLSRTHALMQQQATTGARLDVRTIKLNEDLLIGHEKSLLWTFLFYYAMSERITYNGSYHSMNGVDRLRKEDYQTFQSELKEAKDFAREIKTLYLLLDEEIKKEVSLS